MTLQAPRVQLDMFGGPEVELEPQAPRAPAVVAPHRETSIDREQLAAQVSMAIERRDDLTDGWREELGRKRPTLDRNNVCSAVEDWRRRTDGTLGPCPWVGCKSHALIQVTRLAAGHRADLALHPTSGDRSVLPAIPTDGEVEAFEADALKRLESMPVTCLRDVQRDSHPAQGQRWQDSIETTIADASLAFGVSQETIRQVTLSAAAKLGVSMEGGIPEPHDPRATERILSAIGCGRVVLTDDELAERARRVLDFVGSDEQPADVHAAIAAIDRALVAAREPLVRIRRVEREAPAPVEASADQIFTF